ncbi:hypothetical protein D3C85_1643550 [compost metagenome]
MHQCYAILLGHLQHFLGIQIAFSRLGRANQECLISGFDMLSFSIRFGIDSNGGNAERFGRANNPACDLPSIRD